MINIKIVCVGKIKEKYFKDAIEEYLKRLQRFCKLEIVEVNEELVDSSLKNLDVVKDREGERILQKVQGHLIVLDLHGNNISSEEHAKKINDLSVHGVSTITYIIGGSYGLSKAVLDKADTMLSFGKLTFPHQLMRVVLVEQIYRAFTILEGGSYHK